MPLRSVLGSVFRSSNYRVFNKSQEDLAKRNLLFGTVSVVPTAESIEQEVANRLENDLQEDPRLAKTIVNNALEGKALEPNHKQVLQGLITKEDIQLFQTERAIEQQKAEQNATIAIGAASFAFTATLRLAGNSAANQAVTSGKVVQFERQQQTFNNIKRTAGLLGSLGGLAYASVALGPASIFAAGVAVASQAISIGVENSRISAKQERQDSNAEYYQQAFGNIVRRGNR